MAVMNTILFLVLLGSVLTVSSAAKTESEIEKFQREVDSLAFDSLDHLNLVFEDLPVEDDSDNNSDDDEPYSLVDLKELSPEEFKDYVIAEEELFRGNLNLFVGERTIQKHRSLRPKRWVSLAARAVGGLFGRFARTGITRSGSRITKHYSRPGNYNSAVQDFNRLSPTGVRPITGSRFQGQTGMFGNHRVTTRTGSRQGQPTLEIRSPNGTVRKFRYTNP